MADCQHKFLVTDFQLLLVNAYSLPVETSKGTIARSWKQPKCSLTDKRIKKMWYIYIMEYYSAIKRNETGSFVETWTDLETVIQSEVRKRKTNIIY